MEKGRNFANIGREVGVSGQNRQHFMSESPWSAQAVYRQVQEEIKQTAGLEEGGALWLDESAEEKAGAGSAGAGRQHNAERGWDELQAQKYRAWEHHLALTVWASGFIAQTQYTWARRYERDPDWLQELEVQVLPALSFANVRSLWRAVMPLRPLDPQQAIDPVVEHLFNRTQSRKSRVKTHSVKIE
jgi:hypothetical protein